MNTSKTCDNGGQKRKSMDRSHNIIDPSSIRTKGCGKRLKSSKEKSTSKSRLCRGCGHRGVSHDKRNCPSLQQGSTIDNHHNSDDDTYEEELASIAGPDNLDNLRKFAKQF
ncbi:uncharacterized protein LOC122003649 [Zingiber officinale]|nr:uncharacterized protein LOC121975749 [Zingiber officinale]XP_042386193.1 uncharacterized protein LOC121977836 [Zingiber officinale]XP_042414664.1 uncharacterized protein LOC122003649 [Zingiber officinale]